MSTGSWLARGGTGVAIVAGVVAAALASPVIPKPDAAAIVRELSKSVRDNYVFPDKGEEAAAMLEDNLRAGEYDALDDMELAVRLTEDLRDLTADRHFGVRPRPRVSEGEEARGYIAPPSGTYGFERIERLEGNIGYVDLREFAPRRFAEPTVHAAMRLLQGSDALIFDLRKNGGGDPETVQILCSYLFDPAEPVHLNSLYFRPADETTEFWTQPEELECDAMPDTPVWVLTSGYTFSGGEEFTYNLQTRKRATIVGENTGGGAHPVDAFRLGESPLVAMIPVGRAINPVTGDNWEGKGVRPDVAVPADEALDVAISQALERMADSADPSQAENAAWALTSLRATRGGIGVDEGTLAGLAGDYGDREIELRDGALWYRRANANVGAGWRRLVCVGHDSFVIDGVPDFRLEFDRDDSGAVRGVAGHYKVREPDYSARVN